MHSDQIRKRLLIAGPNWLGDVLFSTPFVRALRKNFPDAFIAYATHARCHELVAKNPHIDEVLDYSPLFAWEVAKRKFQAAYFLHPSRTKVFCARLAGVPERIGYATKRNKAQLTRPVEAPSSLHKVDYFLNLLEACGLSGDGRQPEFFVGEGAERKGRDLLARKNIKNGGPYSIVHAGGNWLLKRWPEKKFAEWTKLYLGKFPQDMVLLCGTASEGGLVRSIQSLQPDPRVVSICGETDIETLAWLMKNARLVLSNDSGPIHLASSQQARILGLFGPTSLALTGPVLGAGSAVMQKDVGCEVPCYFQNCNYRVCMEWLTPEEVFGKTLELLA